MGVRVCECVVPWSLLLKKRRLLQPLRGPSSQLDPAGLRRPGPPTPDPLPRPGSFGVFGRGSDPYSRVTGASSSGRPPPREGSGLPRDIPRLAGRSGPG